MKPTSTTGRVLKKLADKLVDLDQLTGKDYEQRFYKEEPYSTKKLEQRLLITYSPKYAAYQHEMREKQVERTACMLQSGNHKKRERTQTIRPGS